MWTIWAGEYTMNQEQDIHQWIKVEMSFVKLRLTVKLSEKNENRNKPGSIIYIHLALTEHQLMYLI